MATARELVLAGSKALRERGIESAGREAGRLLAEVLGVSEVGLMAADDQQVGADLQRRFEQLVERRGEREPIAYLVGRREFYGRTFQVDSRVLVPRPETEHLVALALALPLPPEARVLDVGTGSGAIGVTLAAERPGWQVVATDISIGAVAVARANAVSLGVAARMRFAIADLIDPIRLGDFDLLVSNPPYVDPEELPWLSRTVRDYEPTVALVSPGGGNQTTERLLRSALEMKPGSHLVVEMGLGRLPALAEAAEQIGGWEVVSVGTDLAGIERDVVFRRRG